MKKLLMLAVVLAAVLVAAIPALAQNVQLAAGVEPATGTEPANEDELICLLPEGCDTDAGIEPAPGDVQRAPDGGDIQPAPGNVQRASDGGNIQPATGDVQRAPGDVQPAPGDGDPVDCSEALEGSSIISRASETASVSEGTSVVPAEEPGCFAITVPGPTDGGS